MIDHYLPLLSILFIRYIHTYIYNNPYEPFEIIMSTEAPRALELSACEAGAGGGYLLAHISILLGRPTVGQFGNDSCTLWLFNIAMENGPLIYGLPIKNGDFPWPC
jgi:hypothetical protein